jgi:uncharacterized membrane protein
MEEEAAGA